MHLVHWLFSAIIKRTYNLVAVSQTIIICQPSLRCFLNMFAKYPLNHFSIVFLFLSLFLFNTFRWCHCTVHFRLPGKLHDICFHHTHASLLHHSSFICMLKPFLMLVLVAAPENPVSRDRYWVPVGGSIC